MSESTGTAFERVQNARHPQRPYSLDIFNTIFSDFVELHGDRRFADDSAMVCGLARLGEREVAVIGQQKGRDTKQRQQRNFGMPKPEGYRKALRIMKLAEKFGRPIITFIDTPGAYPGIDAEERGQAEAIAYNLREMAGLRVPIVVVVVGEGGSGGALAIGIGDRIIMLENAVYSVISPEGCAAILWKSAAEAPAAAEGLRLTADHLSSFGLIDEIVPEPESWAVSENDKSDKNVKSGKDEDIDSHYESVANSLSASLSRHLDELEKMTGDELRLARFKKFRKMGVWV